MILVTQDTQCIWLCMEKYEIFDDSIERSDLKVTLQGEYQTGSVRAHQANIKWDTPPYRARFKYISIIDEELNAYMAGSY